MSASAKSIVELSRRKSRYHDQDRLLSGFVHCAGFTAKEVAVEILDWRYEQYANAPKRAHDLHKLGYLEQLPGRVCRHTGKEAHTYRITAKGREHLRRKGLSAQDRPLVDPPPSKLSESEAKNKFSEMRKLLGD